jgi:hypothetical protein
MLHAACRSSAILILLSMHIVELTILNSHEHTCQMSEWPHFKFAGHIFKDSWHAGATYLIFLKSYGVNFRFSIFSVLARIVCKLRLRWNLGEQKVTVPIGQIIGKSINGIGNTRENVTEASLSHMQSKTHRKCAANFSIVTMGAHDVFPIQQAHFQSCLLMQ